MKEEELKTITRDFILESLEKEGYTIVPIKPTEEQIYAGCNSELWLGAGSPHKEHIKRVTKTYKTMIDVVRRCRYKTKEK